MAQDDLKIYNELNYGKHATRPGNGDIAELMRLTEPDEFVPDVDGAWNNVRSQLQPTRSRDWRWMRVAAMLGLVFGLVVTYVIIFNEPVPTISVSAGKEIRQVILPDGSIATLNRNASIHYAEEFSENRNVKARGDVYFQVAGGPVPFSVQASGVTATVLGTRFAILESNGQTSLFVTEGRVKFSNMRDSKLVSAGMRAISRHESMDIEISNLVDPNELAWATRTFSFRKTKLADALELLEIHFEEEIKLEDPQIGKCLITGTFEGEDLKSILESVCIVLDLKLKSSQNQYLLKGSGC